MEWPYQRRFLIVRPPLPLADSFAGGSPCDKARIPLSSTSSTGDGGLKSFSINVQKSAHFPRLRQCAICSLGDPDNQSLLWCVPCPVLSRLTAVFCLRQQRRRHFAVVRFLFLHVGFGCVTANPHGIQDKTKSLAFSHATIL